MSNTRSIYILLAAFIVLISVMVVMPKQESLTQAKVMSEAGLNVSVDQLWETYKDNSVSANHAYTGKVVIFKGRVTDVGLGLLGRAFIVLEDKVQIVLINGKDSRFQKLKKGDIVLVKGLCKGKLGYLRIGDGMIELIISSET